jgi:hypothetical protein
MACGDLDYCRRKTNRLRIFGDACNTRESDRHFQGFQEKTDFIERAGTKAREDWEAYLVEV